MTDEFKRLLGEELAEEQAPPIGDLVRDSVRQGRRMRRNRNLLLGSSGAAGVAVLIVAVLSVSGLPRGGGGPQRAVPLDGSAPVASADPTSTASTVVPSPGPTGCPIGGSPVAPTPAGTSGELAIEVPCLAVPSPSGERRVATAAGALELLTRLLPAGETSGHAVGDPGVTQPGAVAVQLLLDRGAGPGMLRLWILPDTDPVGATRCSSWQTCYPLDDGGQLIVGIVPDNCVSGLGVTLHRADDVTIHLAVAECLMWEGSINPPAPRALTAQEAVDLVFDPRWGTRLPVEILDVGARRFRDLPRIQGG